MACASAVCLCRGPPEQVQDKVGFIVNNLSAANLDAKARELRGVVTPDMWPWFANYMVVKRAAQEPNFHSLYLQVSIWGSFLPALLCAGVTSGVGLKNDACIHNSASTELLAQYTWVALPQRVQQM